MGDNLCDRHRNPRDEVRMSNDERRNTEGYTAGCPLCEVEQATDSSTSDPQKRHAQDVKIVGGGGVEGVVTLSQRNSGNSDAERSTVIITQDAPVGDND